MFADPPFYLFYEILAIPSTKIGLYQFATKFSKVEFLDIVNIFDIINI